LSSTFAKPLEHLVINLCKWLQIGLRVEWCKSYARVKRWREEVLLLQEEMRRCLVTLDYQADLWTKQAKIDNFDGERLEGASAYGHYQASVRRSIAARFQHLWSSEKVQSCREFQPGTLDLDSVIQGEIEDMENAEMEDVEDQNDYIPSDEELQVDDTIPGNDEDEEDEEENEDEVPEDGEEENLQGEEDVDMESEASDDDMEEGGSLTLKELLWSLEEEQGY
jgi:hypothetical protein